MAVNLQTVVVRVRAAVFEGAARLIRKARTQEKQREPKPSKHISQHHGNQYCSPQTARFSKSPISMNCAHLGAQWPNWTLWFLTTKNRYLRTWEPDTPFVHIDIDEIYLHWTCHVWLPMQPSGMISCYPFVKYRQLREIMFNGEIRMGNFDRIDLPKKSWMAITSASVKSFAIEKLGLSLIRYI